MAKASPDLTGMQFGHLSALRRDGRQGTHVIWLCKCDCGNECRARVTRLLDGSKTHCGCRRGEKNMSHGGAKRSGWDPLYSRWSNMLQRCENPKNPSYPYYGGRGIHVCDEWHDFAVFRKDLNELGFDPSKPNLEQTMDRIDNDGPYAPWNVRLVGYKEQSANRREYHPRGPVKGVEAIDDNGNIVKRFNSITDASKWCGRDKPSSNISAAARGRIKHAFGYKWRYVHAEV